MDNKNEIIYIKLSDIVPNRYQPRIDFDEESLNELIISIKNYGIIEPLVVRQLGDKYELIAGERRYKAASRLGITEVPAIIKNVDDNTSAELALIENLQRKDLNAYEEAKAYEQIINMNNITQEQLASKIGKSQGNIANKLRLLSLPDAVQAALARNSISERHARSLLKLNDRVKQVEILNKIINERLNVKDTDEYIKSLIKPDNQLEQPIDNNLEILDIEDNKENNTVNLQELNINNDNLDIANNNELQIKEKMEINMNQEQNNNQMPNMNFEIQPNQGNSRFFPPLENQTTNMNFNQSLNIPQNQSPVANNFDTNMVEPQMIENNDMITNSLIFNPGQTVNANQDNIVNQQEPITPFVNMNIPTNNSTLTNGPQPITEMPNNFVQPVPNVVENTPVTPIPEVAQPVMPSFMNEPVFNPNQVEPVNNSFLNNEVNQVSNDNPIPVMNNTLPKRDMTLAINTLRSTIETIKNSNYQVATEELDLENEYQFIIKIQK